MKGKNCHIQKVKQIAKLNKSIKKIKAEDVAECLPFDMYDNILCMTLIILDDTYVSNGNLTENELDNKATWQQLICTCQFIYYTYFSCVNNK